jgi:ubiquinone/menaquinone biosynthesis C-methylase UbiE
MLFLRNALEHLPDLPSALSEAFRIIKKQGVFSVVIPCEGGLAYSFARQISTVRIFNRKFGDRGVNYHWLMRKTEHINQPWEILKEIERKFFIDKVSYFPLKIPFVFCNLCIGLNLQKKEIN